MSLDAGATKPRPHPSQQTYSPFYESREVVHAVSRHDVDRCLAGCPFPCGAGSGGFVT